MLVADGGGGGGTDWWSMDVPTMWTYISDIDTEPMWKQSSGWQKAIDLASTNLYRLKDFREKLVTAWPPDKSEASQTYVAKLDELIKSVQDVYDGAVTNKTSASNLASSISEAQYKVKPLYDEYLANLGKQSTYDQNLAAKQQELSDKYGGTTSRSYIYEMNAWKTSNPNPNVAARQQELNEQSRTAMSTLSTDLVVSQGSMVEPQPYTPPELAGKSRGGGGDDTGSSSSSSSTSTGSTGSNSFSSSSSSMPPVVPMPTYIPPSQPSLTGNTYTPPAPTPMPTAPTLPGTPPTGPIGTPPPVAPIGPQGIIGGKNPTGPGGLRPTTTNTGLLRGGGRPTGPMTGGRGLVGPNGVIGGQPGRGGPGGRGVNPAGGVIGGRGGAAGPGGKGGAGAAGGRGAGLAGAGAGRGKKGADEHGNEWDPDNPWEVAEGVTPVVDAPSDAGPIDPGPAIGGRW
jgi:hypothetical protein